MANVWDDLVKTGKKGVDDLIEEYGEIIGRRDHYQLEQDVYDLAGEEGSGFSDSELYQFLQANSSLGTYRSSFGAETIDDILAEAVVETFRQELINYMTEKLRSSDSDDEGDEE